MSTSRTDWISQSMLPAATFQAKPNAAFGANMNVGAINGKLE
jgi:hypothetical protein